MDEITKESACSISHRNLLSLSPTSACTHDIYIGSGTKDWDSMVGFIRLANSCFGFKLLFILKI
jgi:hypothetical protein